MNRYDNTKILINENLKSRYYDLLIYPTIEKLPEDTYIITKVTDRLDVLANKYYGDSKLYWIIGICNNITNTLFPPIGIQLCIPQYNRIVEIISDLNG